MTRSFLCITLATLTFVAILGITPAAAFTPPLTEVQAWHQNIVVWYKVFDPQRQQWMQEYDIWYYKQVLTLINQDGIVAWTADLGGGDYGAYLSFYDPFEKVWQTQCNVANCTSPPELLNADGVVAYRGQQPNYFSRGSYYVEFFTYDPEYHDPWWYDSHWPYNSIQLYNPSIELKNQDGVVTFSFLTPQNNYYVQSWIYDPLHKAWNSDHQGGFTSQPNGLTINQGTVTFYVNGILHTRGFDAGLGGWYEGPTKPQACFVTQPPSKGPWFWFTDLSLGGAAWHWTFGDGGSAITRGAYHQYNRRGVFTVTQEVTSPVGTSAANCQIVLNTTVISPLLMLLLTD